jgi:hypothetical protein
MDKKLICIIEAEGVLNRPASIASPTTDDRASHFPRLLCNSRIANSDCL